MLFLFVRFARAHSTLASLSVRPSALLVALLCALWQPPSCAALWYPNNNYRQSLMSRGAGGGPGPAGTPRMTSASNLPLFGGLGGLLSGGGAGGGAGGDPLWYRERPLAVRKPPTFSCQGLRDGVYGDVDADCRVYHRCAHGFRQTYYCDDDSRFDVSTESCEPADTVVCVQSSPPPAAATTEETPAPTPRRPAVHPRRSSSIDVAAAPDTNFVAKEQATSAAAGAAADDDGGADVSGPAEETKVSNLSLFRPDCVGKIDGLYPAFVGNDCNTYFRCANETAVSDELGEVHLERCPESHVFDFAAQRCCPSNLSSVADDGPTLTPTPSPPPPPTTMAAVPAVGPSSSPHFCLTCVKPKCFPGLGPSRLSVVVGGRAEDGGRDGEDGVAGRFPVAGSRCRAYFRCRRGATDPDFFLCPEGEYFDASKAECRQRSSSELDSDEKEPLPMGCQVDPLSNACSTAVDGAVVTVSKDYSSSTNDNKMSQHEVIFGVCRNSTLVAYGVCPRRQPVYDPATDSCVDGTRRRHQQQGRHAAAAGGDGYDVDVQYSIVPSAPSSSEGDDVVVNFANGGEEDDDAGGNGDDVEPSKLVAVPVQCMELPDGVYPAPPPSTADQTEVCVKCRRGVWAAEFPCDGGNEADGEEAFWSNGTNRAAPSNFCAGRDPGVYADVTQQCKSFVVCRRFRTPVRGFCLGDGETFDDAAGRGCVRGGSCANFQVLSSSSKVSQIVVPAANVQERHAGSSNTVAAMLDMTAAEAYSNNEHSTYGHLALKSGIPAFDSNQEQEVDMADDDSASHSSREDFNPCSDGRIGFFPDLKADCTKYHMCMPGGVRVDQDCAPGLIFDTASQLCKDEKFAVCIDPEPLALPTANCSQLGPGYHFQHNSDCRIWTLCPPDDQESTVLGLPMDVQPKMGTGRGGAAAAFAMPLSNMVPPYLLRPFSSPASAASTSSSFRQLSATLARLQGLRASRFMRRASNSIAQRHGAHNVPSSRTTGGQSWRCPQGTRIDRTRLICRAEDKVSCPVFAPARALLRPNISHSSS